MEGNDEEEDGEGKEGEKKEDDVSNGNGNGGGDTVTATADDDASQSQSDKEEETADGEEGEGEGATEELIDETAEETDSDATASTVDDDDEDKNLTEAQQMELAIKAAHTMNDEYILRYRRMLVSSLVSPEAKGVRIVEAVVDTFGHTYLFCRHLRLILHTFYPIGHRKSSKYFGETNIAHHFFS